MSTTTITPYEGDECRGVLRVYSDSSIIRSPNLSFNVPVHVDSSVFWKDTLFDPANNLYLCLYKPSTPTTSKKLHIFLYVHGGGFCIGSHTWPNCQNYFFLLSSQLQAIVIAPVYRLTPEHHLPAAIHNDFTSLKWLQDQALSKNCDEWLSESADFDRVFISGDSAGGNIAHNMAVKLGVGSPSLAPVRIRGYVLLAPFYGGIELMKSESEGVLDAFLNWELIDRFWRLSIQVRDTMDHPVVNPFGPVIPTFEFQTFDPILIVVGGLDFLKDKCEDYAKRLKNWGNKVDYVEFEELQHGFFTLNLNSVDSKRLMEIIK